MAVQCAGSKAARQLLASISKGLTSSSVSGADASDHVSCRQGGRYQDGCIQVVFSALLTHSGGSPSFQHALRRGPSVLSWVRGQPCSRSS